MIPIYLAAIVPIVFTLFLILNHSWEYERFRTISSTLDKIKKNRYPQARIFFQSTRSAFLFNNADVFSRIEKQLKFLIRQENNRIILRSISRFKMEFDAYRAYVDLDKRVNLLLDQLKIPREKSLEASVTKVLFKKIELLDAINKKLNSIN